MLKKVRENRHVDLSLNLEPYQKVTVCSGLRLILHPSHVEIRSVVFLLSCWKNQPTAGHRRKHLLGGGNHHLSGTFKTSWTE